LGPRLLTLGLLTAVVLGVSALRSPAQKGKVGAAAGPVPTSVTLTLTGQKRKVAPFDLSCVPASSTGAFAIRPHAFFQKALLKEHAPAVLSIFNQNVTATCREQGLRGPLLPPLESIEQIVCAVRIQPIKTKDERQTALMFSLAMVRTLADFDWSKLLRAALPGTVEVRHAGKVYSRAPRGACPFFGPTFAYHVVDRRTVVFTDEAELRAWLDRPADARPRSWADDWKQVECGLVAVAADFRDRRWLDQRRQPEKDMTPDQVALIRNADSLVFGLDATSTSLRFEGIGRARTAGSAARLARAGKVVVEMATSAQDEEERRKPPVVERLVEGLLRARRIEQDGKVVRWRADVKVSLADFGALIAAAEGR
jgi:hypothetical protein